MGILDLPDDLKQRLRDSVVESLARLTEKVPGGNKIARTIRQLSTQAVFYNAFDMAMEGARERFIAEYTTRDEDLVEAIITDGNFWQSKDVRQALMTMIQRPGSWLVNERERETVIQHFADVLPKRVNRERVDKAVTFFLQCVLEELWTLPGVREIHEIYNLQFQKMSAEAAGQQVAFLEAQLQATSQLSADVREGLLQLATILEQRLLAAPQPQPALPNARPYHNLFQPDYPRFVGRQNELDWLRRRLSPKDRAWQMVIAGIGGVGKSSLALAIAHEYHQRYQELAPEERFEAIIWITAKEEVLTIKGQRPSSPLGLIFRTLEDMYTTIAQTLEREDITRAIPEEQDKLVQKALSAQRALLIVDNMESVIDERVRTFLRNLPIPTKCIITSREWVDVADVLKLAGLPPEEADNLINEEALVRDVELDEGHRQLLYKRTSGLPLPIKLSVARMASGETFEQVMRWLGNSTGDLPEYCVKGQIDRARQLDLNAWKLLLACSLFDQDAGASREALGYIADLSIADQDDGLTLLQRLSLLNRTEKDRFWMLPIVQGYTESELTRANFGEILIERWLSWLLEFSRHYRIDLQFHTERAPTGDSEYRHLLTAIRWSHQHERWEILLQLVEGTWFPPFLEGLFSELREMLEAAIQASKVLHNEQHEGQFLRRLGTLFYLQGQYKKALAEGLEKAEEIALRYENYTELGQVYDILSHILADQGSLLKAEQLAERMLNIGERFNDPELKTWAAQHLCEFESKKQRFDNALAWLDRADMWCKELNWLRGLIWNSYFRGATLIEQGNITAAEPFLIESLNMATFWNERRLIALNKLSLAQIYLKTHQLQLAHQMAEEARDLFDRLGMTRKLVEVEELLRKLP